MKSFSLCFLLLCALHLPAQERKLRPSFAEKRWALFHPFAAKKAKAITLEVLKVYQQVRKDSLLAGGHNGGQLDAFRHCFWMASLSQQLPPKKVRKLGRAHEKGNYRDFKKYRLEEGEVPDAVSNEMDLKNNEIGIKLGQKHAETAASALKTLIVEAIKAGQLYIIARDQDGYFVDCQGNRIKSEDYRGKWQVPKCLVRSNQLPGTGIIKQ